ncbi:MULTISPECIES: universal stress protein [Desulfosporosinus]|uniref:Universal stress protein UspA-like protein n=1 Tax=Desulfosporosinus meridiei (strain ATCC BAA-275 / DSM 13257 / KCTC 12902 / NCIMB 13706 / S10) TaxID=768704 RepID=J7IM47_DESMD|nr:MULTISPECIES: universal stress protein [Desulfosporosinus]AFQ42837.1 universal stress protein UspA-like protein [Desulfosporosinus meridiei DSM 13257]KGK87130.1 universal stress protein UspA [Desulfosporosinus sp. HMP52]
MFKRILVPTDGSESSRRALKSALEIAKKFNSEIELFHVTPTPEAYYGYHMGFTSIIDQEQIDKSGELALEITLKGIDIGNVHLTKKHISGHAASGILDEVRREFDLVVMGTVGHGALTGALIGSVTQRVMAQSPCPVLIVK